MDVTGERFFFPRWVQENTLFSGGYIQYKEKMDVAQDWGEQLEECPRRGKKGWDLVHGDLASGEEEGPGSLVYPQGGHILRVCKLAGAPFGWLLLPVKGK